jgi:hypothetical protein
MSALHRRLGVLMLVAVVAAAARAADEPAAYVRFVEEPTGGCVAREAVQVQVQNTHPTRTLRVWLERKVMGQGTGDRSRSELKPGAPPEPLGCSRNGGVEQSWVIVRTVFAD